MVRPELIEYFKENLKNFSIPELRQRLSEEGIPDVDFDESLKAALAPPAKNSPKSLSRNRKLIFMTIGAFLCVGAGLMLFESPSPTSQSSTARTSAAISQAHAVFLGRYGYVVHLPPGYGYLEQFRGPRKTVERVYFAKVGSHSSDFIDTGLYGQLGIVRLDAQPNPWAGQIDGVAQLSATVMARLRGQDAQFSAKDLQIGTLRGIQVDFQAPFSHVEAYLLGPKTLFSFYAGQDDGAYESILTSLRDEASEG